MLRNLQVSGAEKVPHVRKDLVEDDMRAVFWRSGARRNFCSTLYTGFGASRALIVAF